MLQYGLDAACAECFSSSSSQLRGDGDNAYILHAASSSVGV